ncbi:MAG: NADH-quinone oxidoreductase subunit H [Planctomycetes bacterium]|nr:NADH-quinone oxidoreductase subunit H [Planctomycetota bacterium]
MDATRFIHPLLALVLSPLLAGIVNKTKACFAGRSGPPLVQPYRDLWRLLRKGVVYSRTTSWLLRAGPIVSLAAAVTALLLLPLGGIASPLAFAGDLIVFAYLFGLVRFFMVAAALDTGSSFEGMGASREVSFSALAEPAMLLGLAALARPADSLSLSGLLGGHGTVPAIEIPVLLLVAAAMAIILLAENARIPVDDPNTHLELTMIHEVMILDTSGPDLAFAGYAAWLKQWAFAALLVGVAMPWRTGAAWSDLVLALAGVAAVGLGIGLVESTMARLRLVRVPQLLLAAVACAALAVVLVLR